MWELKDKTTNLQSFPMKLIKSNSIEKPREARKHIQKTIIEKIRLTISNIYENWEDKIDDRERSKSSRNWVYGLY
jgi:hypothetical protein